MTPFERRAWLAVLLGAAALVLALRGFWITGYVAAGEEVTGACREGSTFSYRGLNYICRPLQ